MTVWSIVYSLKKIDHYAIHKHTDYITTSIHKYSYYNNMSIHKFTHYIDFMLLHEHMKLPRDSDLNEDHNILCLIK